MKHEYEAVTRFKKRERTQNWTFSEKKFLLDLCKRDMRIIENKRLDSALIALKNRAWKLIHQRFAATFGPDRNCNRLKEQFRRMKALSRSEILDYSHRMSRFGQEVADRKRPSPFSFEIWEFMQDAKKVCKAECMDNVDYSKMHSSLERDDLDSSNSSNQDDDSLCTTIMNKTSHNMDMCEVQIKEEPGLSMECLSDDGQSPRQVEHQLDRGIPASDLSTIAATINTVNLMESVMPRDRSIQTEQQFNMREFYEMQVREHTLRMDILKLQFETAKYNRDIAKLNMNLTLKAVHKG
ncbi:uncharacterized protein LOC132256797 [Phlebotomus argentipes]|uniref:uncharacterized protein LOC132256797 n=1 Tax=Phlebotomus argentipes TaxID=94469 RepID=UPI002892FA72|nr:uncharacterized protein LOC132256797 [Phlebotomus argentipes]XP_059609332.1 uncharacterized protein LOC132256797 [Phlebotomus argentipes]XP_059609333.1 uncharacterized protein LOC132256797 [Phlebotomus argentipes]XP_059609334.1 uncharacterized protein LOC132256797 [Phlebotomus argentipes]